MKFYVPTYLKINDRLNEKICITYLRILNDAKNI